MGSSRNKKGGMKKGNRHFVAVEGSRPLLWRVWDCLCFVYKPGAKAAAVVDYQIDGTCENSLLQNVTPNPSGVSKERLSFPRQHTRVYVFAR